MSAGSPFVAAGVVPAAGASRRMGAPKGLLELGGRTFVERVVGALADGGCAPVYVVIARHGDDASTPAVADHREVGALARQAGAVVLENADPGEGPITSLRMALAAVGPGVGGVVYLPLDHALVEPYHVSRLLHAAEESGAALVVPLHDEERGHPAFFGRPLFDELLDPELEGGARTVVHRHLDRARLLPFDDPAVVTDIDTPAVYAEALRRYESVGP